VNTIISLARTLNMDVIAEGIETEDEVIHLKRLGCERGQGYWFSPPMKQEKLEEHLQNGNQWLVHPQHNDPSVSLPAITTQPVVDVQN